MSAISVDTSSVAGLTRELRRAGVDTRTPGLRADERKNVLLQRLLRYKAENDPGFIPPPPLEKLKTGAWVPPPPREERRASGPPPPKSMSTLDFGLGGQTRKEVGEVRVPPRAMTQLKAAFVKGEETKEIDLVNRRRPTMEEKGPEGGKAMIAGTFDCDQCGKSFKKVAHLIVHSRTHANKPAKNDSQNSFISEMKQAVEEKDSNWIEEFAKGLMNIAKSETVAQPPQQQTIQNNNRRNSIPPPPSQMPPPQMLRRNTMPEKQLQRQGTMSRGFVPPPPKGAPPVHLIRSKSMPNVNIKASPTEKLLEEETMREKVLLFEEDMHTLKAEISEMEQRKSAELRFRLHDSKDIEVQEAEWELEQVQAEIRRLENHQGMFIDSRIGSKSGRMQRWAREDLAARLVDMEAECEYALRSEIAKVRGEIERHPDYGKQAQKVRRDEVSRIEKQIEELKQQQKRNKQTTLARRQSFNGQGEINPNDADALAKHALHLHVVKKQHAQAEETYRKAIALDDTNPTTLGNFALFLSERWSCKLKKQANAISNPPKPYEHEEDLRRNDEEADKYFRMAIKLDPTHPNNLANYASFLKNSFRQYDRAEQYYQRACRAAPENASVLGNYAHFLHKIRKDYGRADRLFRRSLDLKPDHSNNICNYASLLKKMEKYEQAESLYERALETDPRNATILSNYGNLIAKTTDPNDRRPGTMQRLTRALDLYTQALRMDPKHKMAKRNYMIFLRDFPVMRLKSNEKILQTDDAPPPRATNRVRRVRSPKSPKRSPRQGRSQSPPPNLQSVIE